MRLAAMAVLAGLFAALSGLAEAQEKRVALIIGNDAYKGLPKLNNAVADARAMDKKLKELGFETIVRTNAGRVEMNRAVAEFGRKIGTPETVGLVFYSGHGIQAFDRNWLIPVDANLESDDDLRSETLDAQQILSAMDEARNPLNIVILDACRDNPLPKKGRSASRGLAVVSVAPRGSVIAYSASPNQKADDGNPGTNGVYTAELLKALDQPGLTVEQVLKRANGGVQSATGGRQVPWFNASIQGDFYFRPGQGGAPAASGGGSAGASNTERQFWTSTEKADTLESYEAYLKRYPQGAFADLAKVQIEKHKPKTAALASSPTAPQNAVDPVDRELFAVGTTRVREAPDVKSKQLATLRDGQKIYVLGKVKDQDWYLIEQGGKPAGYVAKAGLEEEAAYRERERKRKEQEAQQTAAVTAPAPAAPRPAQPAVGTYDLQPGQVFRDCTDCPEMVVIPAGNFVMGVAPGEEEREGVSDQFKGRSVPQHNVSVRSFMLGKYEVTVGEFARFANETGHRTDGGCYVWNGTKWDIDQSKNWRNPGFGQGDRHPVGCVSWDDAKAYTAWLSRKSGKTYRLATEAEWEYAARAGTSTARYWGDTRDGACDYANVADMMQAEKYYRPKNAENIFMCNDRYADSAAVGSFRPNAFGLYDMIGNVWEWTEDCSSGSYAGAPSDGSAWTSGQCNIRVLRGGSWLEYPWQARSASRYRRDAGDRAPHVGFRVARTY
jgi:formylglycine-generating enzyme required for sulfatase activity/uncharacterized caspase-like protein